MLKKTLSRGLIIGFFLSFGACATQTVYVHGDLTGPPTFSERQTFWLAGIGQEKSINATAVCRRHGKRLSRVVTKRSLGDVLLTGFTLSIYAPMTLEVSCN